MQHSNVQQSPDRSEIDLKSIYGKGDQEKADFSSKILFIRRVFARIAMVRQAAQRAGVRD